MKIRTFQLILYLPHKQLDISPRKALYSWYVNRETLFPAKQYK